jgi:hypothetical protein
MGSGTEFQPRTALAELAEGSTGDTGCASKI